jgi:hypothetical protein
MSGWGKQHEIRIQTMAADIRDRLTAINDLMLHMPERFRLAANETGRGLVLIDMQAQQEEKEPETDGL